MTPEQARKAGRACAAAFPERLKMGEIAKRFLDVLPAEPAGKGEFKAQWRINDNQLRTAWSEGFDEVRGSWTVPAAEAS